MSSSPPTSSSIVVDSSLKGKKDGLLLFMVSERVSASVAKVKTRRCLFRGSCNLCRHFTFFSTASEMIRCWRKTREKSRKHYWNCSSSAFSVKEQRLSAQKSADLHSTTNLQNYITITKRATRQRLNNCILFRDWKRQKSKRESQDTSICMNSLTEHRVIISSFSVNDSETFMVKKEKCWVLFIIKVA